MSANLTTYHSHCNYCDGRASAAEFAEAALSAGFSAYGFSSHAPLPFDTQWTLKADRVNDYLTEIAALKEIYKGRIELYVGMEIDYFDDERNPANAYFQAFPLDYRIGSIHLIRTSDDVIIDIDTTPEKFAALLENRFHGDLKDLVTRYFDTSMRMVELGGFDFVGHCDKVSHNAALINPGITAEPWFMQKITDYFSLLAERGIMVEINTKAYARKGIFFPHVRHFRQLKELRIPVVVNSDAHQLHLINSGRNEALQALREVGIMTVMELHGGEWCETEIG